MFPMNPLNSAFGLDIGDRTFKVVQVTRRSSKKTPRKLTAWGSIDVPEGIMERGEIIDPEKAAEHLIKLIRKIKGRLKGRAVVGCLPEARSFVKVIEMEHSTDREVIHKAVSKEIEQNIPLSTDEIYYDWHLIEHEKSTPVSKPASQETPTETAEKTEKKPEEPAEKEPGNEKPKDEDAKNPEQKPDNEEVAKKEDDSAKPPEDRKMMQVMLAAAPRTLVDSYVQMMEAAGLAPIALEIEATAIARAIVPMGYPLDRALGILDIGATRSSLIVCDEGAVQMSISVPLSGNELTEIISEKLKIDLADAELVKIECGLDARRCEDKMWNILLPLIDDICNKIRNALRFYRVGFPCGKKIEKLILCGGGAHFRDIDTVLSRKLTIKVKRGDSLVNITKLPKNFSEENSLSYTTAIGLALRASDENKRFRHSFRI